MGLIFISVKVWYALPAEHCRTLLNESVKAETTIVPYLTWQSVCYIQAVSDYYHCLSVTSTLSVAATTGTTRRKGHRTTTTEREVWIGRPNWHDRTTTATTRARDERYDKEKRPKRRVGLLGNRMFFFHSPSLSYYLYCYTFLDTRWVTTTTTRRPNWHDRTTTATTRARDERYGDYDGPWYGDFLYRLWLIFTN
jgi:hypothetical protein